MSAGLTAMTVAVVLAALGGFLAMSVTVVAAGLFAVPLALDSFLACAAPEHQRSSNKA